MAKTILGLAALALLAACSEPSVSRSDGPRDLLQTEMLKSVMVSL